jgi:hypothetical protein
MTPQRIHELLSVYRDGLLHDTLPFWINHCVDREYGGFMFALDRDGTVIDADKGIWQQGRFTWLLSTLYNTVEQRDEWLELAAHGIDFIRKFGLTLMVACFFRSHEKAGRFANAAIFSAKLLRPSLWPLIAKRLATNRRSKRR